MSIYWFELFIGPVTDLDDAAVERIRETLGGNQDAFEVLVRRHSSRVFSIIGSFFRRRDMVEDISQDVFARAFFSLAGFTLGRSFEAWVAKIAVNAPMSVFLPSTNFSGRNTTHSHLVSSPCFTSGAFQSSNLSVIAQYYQLMNRLLRSS